MDNYEPYTPILQKIQTLLKKDNATVIVAIDGRCGSGKTRLAEYIAREFPCNVFHMDDYYLPPAGRKKDWEKTVGANIDFERFASEVLEPVRAGGMVRYRPYDCSSGGILRTDDISPKRLNIVEGSYSHHPSLAGYYDAKFFLTCDKEVQSGRLQAREGERYSAFVERWIPLEELYFKEYNVIENADIVADTTADSK